MAVLYISALSSKKLINELYSYNKTDPGFAVQKFNRLLVSGLVENNEDVTILSAAPVNRHNSSKFLWNRQQESEDGLLYKYISFINYPILRQICLVFITFIRTIIWSVCKSKDGRAVVCDVLNAGMCTAAILACHITRTQIIGVMTDMPGLMVRFEISQKMPLRTRLATNLIKWCFSNYDKFVFLTEAMNLVNKKQKPFIVMEGISDGLMAEYCKLYEHDAKRIIMYAGGLHERYGLKILTEAFMLLPFSDVQLRLYGSGPFVAELREKYCKLDERIRYMGIVPNDKVVEAELRATLLVNPRPTDEEFTKYSFPSKNIEYMASGTPLITTKLPGMPIEYHPYVFLIEEETVEGYANTLNQVLTKTDKELFDFGNAAKSFVIHQKNSFRQAKRVIDLIRI